MEFTQSQIRNNFSHSYYMMLVVYLKVTDKKGAVVSL